jgi:hypothetical protein
MAAKPHRGKVALTAQDSTTQVGNLLLGVLEKISHDGRLTDNEIQSLGTWLQKAAAVSELPGIHFLREEVESILSDGEIVDGERNLLVKAILRVLPADRREEVKARFDQIKADEKEREKAEKEKAKEEAKLLRAEEKELARQERIAEANVPTERQIEFITQLGGTLPPGSTKVQASELIDWLLENRPTARQMMVLRFWNRLDLAKSSVDRVSDWMDSFYQEDPFRKEAWELWKAEANESGGRTYYSIGNVPIGAGMEYLSRIKAQQGPPNVPPRIPSNVPPSIPPKIPKITRQQRAQIEQPKMENSPFVFILVGVVLILAVILIMKILKL